MCFFFTFSIQLTDCWYLSTFPSGVFISQSGPEKFLLKCPAIFFLSSMASKQLCFSTNFNFGDKKKSRGVRYGK